MGYQVTTKTTWSPEYERIVIYAKDGKPTHAARQVSQTAWTSKLGQNVDIGHATPEAVEGPVYGQAAIYLERPTARPATAPTQST